MRISTCLAVLTLCAGVSLGKEDPNEAALKAEAQALAARLGSKDPDEVYSAIKEAALNQHALLTTPLAKLLKNSRPEIRKTAAEALGTRVDAGARKKAAKALSGRLAPLSKKVETQDELLTVIQALDDLAEPSSIKPLLDGINRDTESSVARARIMAVANVPEPEAVDALIDFAAKGRRGNRNAKSVRGALQYATGEKIRGDVDQWRSWWKSVRKNFDFDAVKAKREADKRSKAEKKNRKKRKKNK